MRRSLFYSRIYRLKISKGVKKLKQKCLKRISIIIAFLIVILSFCSFAGAQTAPQLQPKILENVLRIPLNEQDGEALSVPLWNCDVSADALLDHDTIDFLSAADIAPDNQSTVTVVQDSTLNRTVNRIDTETARIELDDQNRLVSFINLTDVGTIGREKILLDNTPLSTNSVESTNDLQTTITELESFLNLSSYTLVTCEEQIQNYWTLVWEKNLGNGLLNPFDIVAVTVDGTDGSISLITRNTIEPNATEPIVTASRAVALARPVTDLFDYDTISTRLSIVRPNFYWESVDNIFYEEADFIRLAWIVEIDDSVSAYIDALTGEILGGGRTKATYARAVASLPDFFGNSISAEMAERGLISLGYTHPEPRVDTGMRQIDIDYVLFHANLKGLYLSCHGSGTHISGDNNWIIYPSQISSGWKFVFLDACYSSVSPFPQRFIDVGGSNQCFVGWNDEIWDVTAYRFCEEFWRRTNSVSILNAVLLAQNAVIAAGYTDCKPGFWGDLNYYGRP